MNSIDFRQANELFNLDLVGLEDSGADHDDCKRTYQEDHCLCPG